ncbi:MULTISPECIES: phosphoribosylglycinamide formyltransferase [Dyella]|uniref:Phosphoribosylglycinamide formyltransferase n=2 Tax=Dyella TaxID=231454 RepID=A0A4R0YMS3_9GAMM|nr:MULTISPECIES: phosphoribosylglycinamide formyltransferase [Dyella]TBR37139.1 phosphoribosylglycinamide formyltransferase [Dyella terrae]TCI07771.1 phosphoribosylglycinamide formyltransferase [Dyella soli]
MAKPFRIAVLASGRGSNLAALIQAHRAGQLPAELALVGSDKANAGALELAAEAGIETFVLRQRDFDSRRDFDFALFDQLAKANIDLLVLAGFMRIIDGDALRPWVGRMINIHPSLLPKYRGLHTHRRALEAGDREHGASVHYVTAELDGGPVIAQSRLAIESGDTEQTLAQRLLVQEHQLLPAVAAWIAEGRLTLDPPDRIRLDGVELAAPLRLEAGQLVR